MRFDTVIPAGGIYEISKGKKLTEGESFPVPKERDSFGYKDYTYIYIERFDGWQVILEDKEKTSYESPLESIAGIPVTSVSYTFAGCKKITAAPDIPKSVLYMQGTFMDCELLNHVPKLPDSLKDLSHAFNNCFALTKIPKLPNSITNMAATFYGCKSLTKIPKLPEEVTNLDSAFESCQSLVEGPEIPKNVTCLDFAFLGCLSLKTVPKLPDNIITMSYAFGECKKLTSRIIVPKNVEKIERAFTRCLSLKTVIIKNPELNIYKAFDKDAKVKIEGLSKNNIEKFKKDFPKAIFKSNSRLSEFIEENKENPQL